MEEKSIKITCTSDQYLSLDQLSPFEENPRELSKPGFNRLRKSITELGIFKPFIVWKKDKSVLGGNQRLRVLKYLVEEEGYKIDQLPVTILNVTEPIARVIVLRDNQPDGEWSYEDLAVFIKGLQDLDPQLVELAGYDKKMTADILKLLDTPDDLREKLDDMAGEDSDEDINDDIKKTLGVSFKVPEEDIDLYNSVMTKAEEETGSADVWTNLKVIFEQYDD